MDDDTDVIKNELSIIIPAWKADKWINTCLQSIYNQTWINKNSDWEILIGIDCCERTRRSINCNKNLRIFFFNKHGGPYIIRNTLAYKEAKYSNLLYFDSDDIMESDLIESCFELNKPFITFQYGIGKDNVLTSSGSSFVKKELLIEYGGYQPWLCAADTDFIGRIVANGYEWSKLTGKNYMIRGRHNKQLTRMPSTGRHSSLRKNYQQQIIKNLENKIYYIEPTFGSYKELLKLNSNNNIFKRRRLQFN